MAIQSTVGVRLTLVGDGQNNEVLLDLKRTIIQFADARYGLLSLPPDSIISLRMGGPDMSPEDAVDHKMVTACLDGSRLRLTFSRPLMEHRDGYTVEIVFGYNGVEDEPILEAMESTLDA